MNPQKQALHPHRHITFSISQEERTRIEASLESEYAVSVSDWVRRKAQMFCSLVALSKDHPHAEILFSNQDKSLNGKSIRLTSLFHKAVSHPHRISLIIQDGLYALLNHYDGWSVQDMLYSACLFAWIVQETSYERIAVLDGDNPLIVLSIEQLRQHF